jgi:hypothetical protein
MLYTAMKEHPCYAGYLWAPFDAFLNIPRLAQFDQRRIWYHSPFGEHVPNPALKGKGVSTTDGELVKNMHPPSAQISDDTPAGYAAKFHPFGSDQWNWWWG